MPRLWGFASAGTKGPPISRIEAQELLDLAIPPTKEELEAREAAEVAAKEAEKKRNKSTPSQCGGGSGGGKYNITKYSLSLSGIFSPR